MRSCDEILEWISTSLDGELSADEQAALDEHIACCPACSALLDDLRALHVAAADWEEVPAPAGFAEAVMSAIAAETVQGKPDNVIPFAPKKAKRNSWKKWGLSAAAIAIVVLGAVSAPSLLGNFNTAKNESMADMAYARDDSSAEVVMDMVKEECAEDSMTSAQAERDIEIVETPAEPAPSEEIQYTVTTAPQKPAEDIPSPSTAPEEAPYVGELILEGMLETLSGQEGAASSDGTVTYIVPADLFIEVYKELEEKKPVGYFYTAGNPGASRGKIIVQSN